MLCVAVLIKYKMPGPALFCQRRTGRNGRPFTIYKFRTMILDHGGSSISLKGESRITPLGAILRKYKIDELPELWNVLKGDMSFVGPRPDIPEYTHKLSGEELKILDLRPGITSPASIKYFNEEELVASAPDPQNFYNEVIWPDKVKINLEYYYERSFLGDIMIILRTIFNIRSIKEKKGESKNCSK
jgi:lipopolysaccharide/colanic/teichoic acid biosynthesis glycosyltransferase